MKKLLQLLTGQLRLIRHNAEAWYNRGAVHDLQGDYNSAIQDYNRAIEIDPSHQKALINKNKDIDIITDQWPDWNQYYAN